MRHGIILVEALAAAALLTLIVAACIPLLRSARRDLAVDRAPLDSAAIGALRIAADDLLALQPDLAGRALGEPAGLQLRWTDRGQQYSTEIRVECVAAAAHDEQRSSHAWLVLSSGGVELPCWVRLSEPPPEQEPGP